ncbi:glycosyltransferase family 2 protein [Aeromonas enteropelogenes]|uniref:glycosyltransferase family 2 protein n=1 Tax=Aeromonas enteropelogenes TaxID=29489 RepID=UPI002285E778|nr:glycosyltransferase family 2 protein [Aeromonas enteropelogenes]MCZ0750707.1 glycosyltransferase family 2 protein [Aeromonas enteropelogenes]
MKLSVLVPVYNLERFIEPCLLSLLEQTTNFDFEVIAIDDGSCDGSWSIMQRLAARWPQLRALQNPQNMGVCLTIRALLEQARGTYLAYVDGDDLALSGKLQALVDHLDRYPDCGFVYHEAEVFDSDSNQTTSHFSRDYYNAKYIPERAGPEHLVQYGLFFNTSSCAFRRHERMTDAVNLDCHVVNDYSWHILNSFYLGGKIDRIPQVYGRYRVHGGSICGSIRSSEERRKLALQDMLAACDLALNAGMDELLVKRGKSHLWFSTALYFLRAKNWALFDLFITDSAQYQWFFDERHKFAWQHKNEPERVFEQIFG